MKVAICFYGLVGSCEKKYGVGKSLDPKIALKYYKKNIFKYIKDYDVFIHSQSIEHKKILKKLYSPKQVLFEKRKNFFFKVILNLKFLKSILASLITGSSLSRKYKRSFSNYSRWYSTKKTLELKKKFEKENNIKYDLVLLTRLDWAFLTPFKMNKAMIKKFTISNYNEVPSPRNNYKVKIKKNNLTFNKGLADYWFIASSKTMDNFSKLYDKIENYDLSPHVCALQHAKSLKVIFNFYKFRGLDHEAVRRIKFSKE